MGKNYIVKLLSKAYRDLDGIYCYIADEFKETGTAEQLADLLEEQILGLNVMPYRGAERKTGEFANRGYRQIFVKNFTIIYRINERKEEVIVITIRYTPSSY